MHAVKLPQVGARQSSKGRVQSRGAPAGPRPPRSRDFYECFINGTLPAGLPPGSDESHISSP